LAGIYIHIPFCKSKCPYCNFFSLASRRYRDRFPDALKQEISLTRDYLGTAEVSTIYFGGGTPSLYVPGVLQEINELLVGPADVPREITLEINPEDVTGSFIRELKTTWFNRFSLGIQSFKDDELRYLGRRHSAGQSMQAVRQLQDAGYTNLSIDLIYGLPGSSLPRWQENLDLAFSLNVPHLSAYALTVEPGTPLAWMMDHGRSPRISDDRQVSQFRMLTERSSEQGFIQYEISNFCKPGHHAIHNTNYWKGVPYLGLGPSAHSYNGTSRRWNISRVSEYLDRMSAGACIYEEEILSTEQRYNEYVMTSLRTMWGCETAKILADFGPEFLDYFRKEALLMIGQGWLKEVSGTYFLTAEGKLFADRVAADLFVVG